MSLGGIRERIGPVDLHLEPTGTDPAEYVRGPPAQFFRIANVVCEIGPRKKQRALLTENERIDLPDGTAGLTEAGHEATRSKAVQALEEGSFTHGIVYDIDAFAIRDPLHFVDEIGLRV